MEDEVKKIPEPLNKISISEENVGKEKIDSAPPKLLSCFTCDSKFENPAFLEKHIASVHVRKNLFDEKTPNSSIEDGKNMVNEQIKGASLKLLSCFTCDSKFGNPDLLEKHITTVHVGIKLYNEKNPNNSISTENKAKHLPKSSQEENKKASQVTITLGIEIWSRSW